MNKKPGYILFVTFSMLALCTTIVSLFVMQGLEHKRFVQALMQKQRVHQFAVSCISLGQSFLTFSQDQMDAVGQESMAQKVDKAQTSDGDSGFGRLMLDRVFPVINQSQTINLSADVDGVDAKIETILFCENGKININSLYNVVDQKFFDEGVDKKDKKVFAKALFEKIAAITGKQSLMKPFTEYMKKRKSPLNDVTELLEIKEFSQCFADNVFYQPQEKDEDYNSKKDVGKLFLTDLFTVSSEDSTLQPWLLSPSVCVLLGIQSKEKKEKSVSDEKPDTTALAQFKQKENWATSWDTTLEPVYGISYQQIPTQFQLVLTSEFQVNIFSLLIKVTIGDVSSRVFAILKQRKLPNRDIFYDIIKVYQV